MSFADGLRNTLGFSHFAEQGSRFAPEFRIGVVGDELLVTVDGVPMYRTSASAPTFTDDFREDIRRLYLRGLRALIERG